jgi:hypothetical protein
MVLGRSKRLNAGKASKRLNKPELSTLSPPTQLKTWKKALKSLKKTALPAKRLVLSIKPQATQAIQAN